MDWSPEIERAWRETSAVAMAVFSTSGRLLDANCGMRSLLDLDGQAMTPCQRLRNPSLEQLLALPSGNDPLFEGMMTFGDGNHPGVSLAARVFRRGDELLIICEYDFQDLSRANDAIAALNRDLNHAQRELLVEQRLLQERTAQLRALAEDLVQTERQQRCRLARILHEELQQLLVAVKIKLTRLHKYVGEAGRSLTAEAADLLDQALAESRAVTAELSPPALHAAGLVAGLRWLARHVEQKHHLLCTVEADPPDVPCSEAMGEFVFQAVRELLLNVVKHARTDRAVVNLRQAGEHELVVTVADQGAGFDGASGMACAADRGSFGLLNLRERLGSLGGQMLVHSAPGQGTRIVLQVPLEAPIAAS